MEILFDILQTENDYVYLILRLAAGIIIFPYGMQKLLGWFDDMGGGVGIKETFFKMRAKKIPGFITWMVIIGQSLGSIALILGCLGRVAALGNFVIFLGALFVHLPEGWTLNWLKNKKGEGIEYFVLLLAILLIIILKGTGTLSVDYWLISSKIILR
ncbi:DoxX family protein [Chryseobacterium sp. ISL-6]|uniref:DoxX family protein n=1 Tax=Chryseobacterium sp. ISL-6 TaxID=2819143 RepID=UPI001BEB989F|nr:DoxX family protein [Chryseobacterium sp. ISL-6]MBT2619357.1 DoxX family protein [Chryseobacterium sp. ISL-6]